MIGDIWPKTQNSGMYVMPCHGCMLYVMPEGVVLVVLYTAIRAAALGCMKNNNAHVSNQTSERN
jgi:hypothetical protein